MLDKNFDPESFEKNYSFEIEASVRKPNAEPFMVLLPPPNITGSLHIGHSLCYTLQDILARYKRLRGYDVLFQPGLDHAGIVTQLLVEKYLYEKGVEKGSLTREALLKEIWFWKENSGYKILDQLKVLGISCDFSRLRFTMDEESKKAVMKMFVKLFDDGLIYRGERMVNWDPLIRSAISDLEVIEKEVNGNLWHIKYKIEGSDDYIIIATSRPETIFGDTAIAVNPSDSRYTDLVGKKAIVPLCERVIPIIADKYADPTKGSGAVKITPAHDFNDFEVGKRNKLPIIDIMTSRGELNENVPEMFQHLDRFEARKKVVEFLEKKELIDKIEPVKQMMPFGDRSGVILEPRITYQWFINAEKLAKPAIEAVKNGDLKFVPKHWENLYFEWMENIRPWCISRQIWWGHRIPAWYGPDGQVFVAENLKEATKKAIKFYGKNQVELIQDEDVLDTWFSSGMWPYVTLGWPEKTSELKRYYKNSIVVTGFDIIFFWVSRMIMFGLYTMKEVPFKDVYIHGLVRDERGKKMSKSKGNVIDPLELCKKYGADSVRYTLASMASPGRDLKISDRTVENGRNFLTKLWNVVRFAQMNGCSSLDKNFKINDVSHPILKWMISNVRNMVADVENAIENYRFDDASRFIYQCVWNTFCDWYMEFIKILLQHPSEDYAPKKIEGYNLFYTMLKKDIRDTTAWAILQFVRVLYPIAPFISKKLSGELGEMDMKWPDFKKVTLDCEESVKEVEFIKQVITSIRSMKQCLGIPVGEKLNIYFEMTNENLIEKINCYTEIISYLAGVSINKERSKGQTIPVVLNGLVIYIEFEGKIDIETERKRLNSEIIKLEKLRNDAILRLNNDDFIQKASEEVIFEHKERVENLNSRIQQINYVIQSIGVIA